MLSAGQFPPPDRRIGRVTVWRPATVQAWIEGDDTKGGR
jgi:predicted DNA-binding transcriptional regulator AlpA